MYNEDEYLMLSGIQHFCFCRRQWALIHIEQQWEENYHTVAGNIMHSRAHDEHLIEKRGNKLTVRGMRIASPRLGISGQCDVVEFLKAEEGITLPDYDGKWSVCPVEYKKGEKKEGQEDCLQLCAQAMCLEEMLMTEIARGFLYYGKTRHREEVRFDAELRGEVEKLTVEMHQLFARGYTPKVKYNTKCRACSLANVCLPKLQRYKNVSDYIDEMTEVKEEVRDEKTAEYTVCDDRG